MVTIRMALEDDRIRPAVGDRVRALMAFAVAVALLRTGPLRSTLMVARVVKGAVRRPATPTEVERAILACAWVARLFPGRAACLENSLSAFLATAMMGRAADWCIGCRFAPCQSHAWVEASGIPGAVTDRASEFYYVTIRT